MRPAAETSRCCWRRCGKYCGSGVRRDEPMAWWTGPLDQAAGFESAHRGSAGLAAAAVDNWRHDRLAGLDQVSHQDRRRMADGPDGLRHGPPVAVRTRFLHGLPVPMPVLAPERNPVARRDGAAALEKARIHRPGHVL